MEFVHFTELTKAMKSPFAKRVNKHIMKSGQRKKGTTNPILLKQHRDNRRSKAMQFPKAWSLNFGAINPLRMACRMNEETFAPPVDRQLLNFAHLGTSLDDPLVLCIYTTFALASMRKAQRFDVSLDLELFPHLL